MTYCFLGQVIDDHEDSLGGATAAYSREPVPGIQQAQATEDGLVDQPSVVERNARTVIAVLEVVRAGLNSAAEVRAVSQGRAASLPAQPSHEAPLESPPSVECVSEDSPQYPPSLTGRHHPEEAGGFSIQASHPTNILDKPGGSLSNRYVCLRQEHDAVASACIGTGSCLHFCRLCHQTL